ncbi:MAG: hypothetical protein KatS3mg096_216 [Candidatus Parcubacteria bacterium]|nr:MAG: hypothetical protein KatS3mg096_216 [Candidatus Parcubacteria bacterium]
MEPGSVKNGFTLLESVAVLFIFLVIITVVSQIYTNLMRSAILAQNFQLTMDNVRFGAEKVWNEIKNGSNFVLSGNSLQFLDRLCRPVRIYVSGENLIYEVSGQASPLFDNNLVSLTSFRIYYDVPSGDPSFYFGRANKVFILNYEVNLKTKTLVIPFSVRQAVAPFNSAFINNPCP